MAILYKYPSDSKCNIMEMQDGDVAVILESNRSNLPVNSIVQRYENTLIPIGVRSGMCYPAYFTTTMMVSGYNIEVRILKSGTLIEL